MTNVVIVVKDGRVEQAYCRNKNVEVEVLDMDTQDIDDLEQIEWRLKQIQNAKSYKELLQSLNDDSIWKITKPQMENKVMELLITYFSRRFIYWQRRREIIM